MTTDGIEPIDPAALAQCLRVLELVNQLPVDHPDAVAVRRATAKVFKSVKAQRRATLRASVAAADRAVVAATATGSPQRIDDETQGIALVSNAVGASAGRLIRARNCYICKDLYQDVDAFYHQLCPTCAKKSHERRDARTDLTGRRALLTGGRAKIGMYIALRLLRDGAHTTITTRFPNDAVRRFAAMDDSADWLHRLRIVGIDLRDPAQVDALADSVIAAGPLDILINNAAQTVRRAPGLVLGPDRGRVRAAAGRRAARDRDVRPCARRASGRAARGHHTIASDRARADRTGLAGRLGVTGRDRGRSTPSTPAVWCPNSPPPTAG